MQISRLFEIIYILLENPTVTAAALAERFEVSARTIYRDVETLAQAGIPIYMSKGKGGGISLLPDFILNKAVLTEPEKEEILSAMRAVSAVNLSTGGTAFNKLCSMLGERNSDWIEVDFTSWGNFQNDKEIFENLKTAILERQAVTFTYASGKAEKLTRRVLPLKLVFKGAAWYLYGFCEMRKDFRFFKLRRMGCPVLTGESFDIAAPDNILTNLPLDPSTFIMGKFRISAKMAFRVYDEISVYETAENGDFLCELYLPDIGIICNYAASFGEYCTVLAPEDAVLEMKRRLENSLRNYS